MATQASNDSRLKEAIVTKVVNFEIDPYTETAVDILKQFGLELEGQALKDFTNEWTNFCFQFLIYEAKHDETDLMWSTIGHTSAWEGQLIHCLTATEPWAPHETMIGWFDIEAPPAFIRLT